MLIEWGMTHTILSQKDYWAGHQTDYTLTSRMKIMKSALGKSVLFE